MSEIIYNARKEKILAYFHDESYRPLQFKELIAVLDVPKSDIPEFQKILEALENSGEIYRTQRNRYALPDQMNLVAGRLQGNERGFGFVIPDQTDKDDVYIPGDGMKGALHGDRVVARVLRKGAGTRGQEGEIVRVTERANTMLTGTYDEDRYFGFLEPDNRRICADILIPKTETLGAKPGQKVMVEVTAWPDSRRAIQGRVAEILGDAGSLETEILSVLRSHGIPGDFPEDVLAEAESFPAEVGDDIPEGRRDLRSRVIVTIDGEDAKDLDDAVDVERLPDGGFRLGVHIADVSHYVREGSALDREAVSRGTSVYFPGRVTPMLPHALSNGLCSLNPKVNRLAFSVDMVINASGQVTSHDIYESVIRTRERMTYTAVTAILEGDAAAAEKYRDLVPLFRDMADLQEVLYQRRKARGAIDFDFAETAVAVGPDLEPLGVVKRERLTAHRIIEEMMLVCNETVAEHYFWANAPFVFRIHEQPDPERINSFLRFVRNLGYKVRNTDKIKPAMLQTILAEVAGTPHEKVVGMLMLRSLAKARYSHEHDPHFGLAASYYTHFTSPIRRYPDLLIHRIMKAYLKGHPGEAWEKRMALKVPELAAQSSQRERAAEEAERDVEGMLMARFMAKHVGETFSGVISSVTSFGLFIELDNGVEGLVRLGSLNDDFYDYDEERLLLRGSHTGRVLTVGDPMEVLVAKVDIGARQIDLEPVGIHARDDRPGRVAASGGPGSRSEKLRGSRQGIRTETSGQGKKSGKPGQKKKGKPFPPKGVRKKSKGKGRT